MAKRTRPLEGGKSRPPPYDGDVSDPGDIQEERTRAAAARRHWRRLWRVGVGSVLVLAGIAMCVLPGPGIVTIIAGLAVMADEVPAAERLMNYLKRRAREAKDRITG